MYTIFKFYYMKKIFILASAITLSTTMYAQKFTKGKYFVGSSSNLSWSSETLDFPGAKAVSTTSLDLSGGYFFMDNIMVRGGLGYSKVGDGTADVSFGLGARYYAKEKFFGQAMYNILPSKTSMDKEGKTVEVGSSSISLGAGYVHSLNDFITIEPMVTYDMKNVDGASYSKTLGVRVGLGIYF